MWSGFTRSISAWCAWYRLRLGHITPPVGLCLFVGMAISGLPMDKR